MIFGDIAKYQTYESSILSLFAECAWGKVDAKKETWTLFTDKLYFEKPRDDVISYSDFLKSIYSPKNEIQLPNKDERMKYNQEMKNQRARLVDQFVEIGHPGEELRDHFYSILEKLKIPDDVIDKINNGETLDFFADLYRNGYFFVFLSLFITMIKLQQENRDFAIVFRSFGYDTNDVLKEFNAFCTGQHPMFTGEEGKFPRVYFDGTHGSKNYVVKQDNSGFIYRFSQDFEHLTLIRGVNERLQKTPLELSDYYKYEIMQGNVEIINGGMNIYNYICDNIVTSKYNSFSMVDEYNMWFTHDEKPSFGKLFLINPYNFNLHQIFFDDNISRDDRSIVDCKNVITGKTMDTYNVWNKFIFRVDSLRAAVDINYFYSCIQIAEEKRKEEYDNMNVTKIFGTTTKKIIQRIVDEGMHLYEKEGSGLSLAQFFANYVVANKEIIEQKLK